MLLFIASFVLSVVRRFLVESEGSRVDRKVRETASFHLDPISSKSDHRKQIIKQKSKEA